MMSEEFFEVLRDRAETRLGGSAKYKAQGFVASQMYEAAVVAINATIEALKEMMVGEPIKARAHHYLSRYLPGEERTEYLVETEQGHGALFKVAGHHGTDGKEVTVLVLEHD